MQVGIEYHALPNGALEDGQDLPMLPAELINTIIFDGLRTFGWTISNEENLHYNGPTQLQKKITVQRGEETLIINVFCMQVRKTSRNNPYEKRIQLTRDYQEHQVQFELDNNSQEKCLLLGVYSRHGIDVIVAYDKTQYLDHKNPNSCYVDIRAISKAMRDGFATWKNSIGYVVCCFRKELLPVYITNIRRIHSDNEAVQVGEEHQAQLELDNNGQHMPELAPPDYPRNLIIYGAPGTGKSHTLNKRVNQHFSDARLHQRVTFYSDYTYGQFVGAYKPTPLYQRSDTRLFEQDQQTIAAAFSPIIDYRFVPGPFLDSLVNARLNPNSNFVVIIEEINRSDAASVFGDAFQMLDRDPDGTSSYPCTLTPEAMSFLKSRGIDEAQVSIPANLYIWATMNSADQGVLPLDSAFKRRWSFEYMPLDYFNNETQEWNIQLSFIEGATNWNHLRNRINRRLIENSISEDRLIGPFFLRKEELNHEGFKNKLLMYLHEDVLRDDPLALFTNETLSDSIKSYDNNQPVFSIDL